MTVQGVIALGVAQDIGRYEGRIIKVKKSASSSKKKSRSDG